MSAGVEAGNREILGVAISSDGLWGLTASSQRRGGGYHGELLLWDGATGRLLRTLDKGKEFVYASFSPDGKTVVAKRLDGLFNRVWGWPVVLWDAITGQKLRELGSDTQRYSQPQWSTDGKQLRCRSSAGPHSPRCHQRQRAAKPQKRRDALPRSEPADARRPARLYARRPTRHLGPPHRPSDGAAGRREDRVQRFRSRSKRPGSCATLGGEAEFGSAIGVVGRGFAPQAAHGPPEPACPPTFSPDCRLIAACVSDNCADYVGRAATGKPLHEWKGPRIGKALAFSPDSRSILVATADGTALWDAKSFQKLRDLDACGAGADFAVRCSAPEATW